MSLISYPKEEIMYRKVFLFSLFTFFMQPTLALAQPQQTPPTHNDQSQNIMIVPKIIPYIQDAIDAAANGDIILVLPGTYYENIDFLGKAITVKSDTGPEYTIIDGSQVRSVVTFNNGEGNNSILDGFTITNGSGNTRQRLIKSNDHGDNFKYCGFDLKLVQTVYAHDSNRIYACVEDCLFYSHDGGKHWDPANLEDDITCLISIPPQAFVFFAGTNGNGIFKSMNWGVDWSYSGLSGQSVQVLSYIPDIFAGTLTGGVFKTKDYGDTWIQINNGLNDLNVQAITYDPIDENIQYLGTSSAGIYRSLDSGINWSPINNGISHFDIRGLSATKFYQDPFHVSSIALDPSNTDIVFIATSGHGLLKSTNGGHDWSVSFEDADIYHVSIDPQSPSTIYAAGTGIYKSIDGGNTWSDLLFTGPYLESIQVDPKNSNIVYAVPNPKDDNIYKSVDGGINWAPCGLSGYYVEEMAIDPNNPDILYVCEWGDGVLKSLDGGTSWYHVNNGLTTPDIREIEINPINPNILYVIADYYDPKLFKTEDGGNNWNQVLTFPTGYPLNWYKDEVICDPINSDTVYVGCFNGRIQKSSDGGVTWFPAHIHLPSKCIYLIEIHPLNSNIIYAGSEFNDLFKTEDSGDNWYSINNDESVILFAATFGGGAFRSFDRGDNWSVINNGLDGKYDLESIFSEPFNGTRLYTHTKEDGLFTSGDGGLNWKYTSFYHATCSIADISVVKDKPNVLYVSSIEDNGITKGGGIYGTASPVIRNNIITNNNSDIGGGIFCNGLNIVVDSNDISYNSSVQNGGGIYCEISKPSILNNHIKNNTSNKNGGGIYCSKGAAIEYNTIEQNNAANYGGGIYGGSNLRGNVIRNNTAVLKGGGAYGVHELTNTLITGNTTTDAFSNGGGVYNFNIMVNNTISNNASNGYFSLGGGIYLDSGNSTIINSIIWDNFAPSRPEIFGYPTVTYSDVKGGFTGTGNIDTDPLFLNPNGGYYYLKQDPCNPGVNNPCVDAGDPNSAMVPGTTRVDEVQDSGIVDMGYHYPIEGGTFHVPDMFSTIQEAIDAAANGFTILVGPGTYHENLNYKGKAINVQSDMGPDVTVIDGYIPNSGYGTVITFDSGEGENSVIDGFSIINGFKYGSGYGAGISIHSASPTIINNIIKYNNPQAQECTGGIYCENSSVKIINNIISDNNSGGIKCINSLPYIVNNELKLNKAIAIHCIDSIPTIMGNSIIGNHLGILCAWCDAIIANNICWYNQHTSTPKGAGISVTDGTYIITNNTIVNNSAPNGGGIGIGGNCDVTITNTIIWDNHASTGKDLGVFCNAASPSTLTISFSDVEGGQISVFLDPSATLNWGQGMIDADPLFVDPTWNDFHLTSNSPCRNAGDNDAPELPEQDFEGDPRIIEGVVDMGADEYSGALNRRR